MILIVNIADNLITLGRYPKQIWDTYSRLFTWPFRYMLFTSGHIFVVERGRKYKDFSLFLTTWREISSQFITMRDIIIIQMIYEALILCMFVNPVSYLFLLTKNEGRITDLRKVPLVIQSPMPRNEGCIEISILVFDIFLFSSELKVTNSFESP